MEFYLVDVKSTMDVNGIDVAFDYINTYLNLSVALNEAMKLAENEDVLDVSVHKWILKEDGTQEHAEDIHEGVLYHYVNRDHRELSR